MTEQDERRRLLLGEETYRAAFELGFNAPPPPPDVAARITALLAAAAVNAPQRERDPAAPAA